MHGIGNDFMVIDGITQKVFFSQEQIKRLGDRHFGVGFDQLLLVEPPYKPDQDFHYRIFNQDGSEVQMCGNGARCFARFVVEKGLCNKKEIHVSTMSGNLILTLEGNNQVTVNMGVPILEPKKIPFNMNQQSNFYKIPVDSPDLPMNYLTIGAVSMGNPHLDLCVTDIKDPLIDKLGPYLESHPLFPQRVNVGFMQVINRNEINLRVYERGAGETLACGSGACAAVVTGILQNLLDSCVKVHLPGGDLTVSWGGEGQSVMLTGPATTVYEGEVKI